MKKQTIAIIGAGSTGLSTALNLSRLGDSRIIVFDQAIAGSGQTGHCCGFVRNFYNVKEMAFSAHFSMIQIKNICSRNKYLKYVKKGLLVIDKQANKKSIAANVSLLKSLGTGAEVLEGKSINKIHPYLETKGVCAGFDQEAGYINPRLVVDYLKDKCISRGVRLIEQTRVTGLKRRRGKFIVETGIADIKADKVVNATAAFTNKINRFLDFQLPIKVIKSNNCFYRLPVGLHSCQVAMADFVNLFYIIPHPEFIDVSTLVLDLKQEVDPETANIDELSPGISQEYLNLIGRRVKEANRAIPMGGFGSCLDVSPDYYPILSRIDEIPNYYCTAGFSGTGFKHFPMIGKLMAEIILEKKPTFPDLASFFRYDRFKRSKTRQRVSDSYFVKD